MRRMPRLLRAIWPTLALWLACAAPAARAHPLIEDALDATVSPQKLSVELRVAPEEIAVEGGGPAGQGPSTELRRAHAAYVAKHLRVEVDGLLLTPSVIAEKSATGAGPLVPYHLEYAFTRPPQVVRLEQTLLADHDPWTVSCVLRFRKTNKRRSRPAS